MSYKIGFLGREEEKVLLEKAVINDKVGGSASYGSMTIIPEEMIGMGHSDDTQLGTSTFCIDRGDIKLTGHPTATIDFGSSMNFQEMQSDLGVDVEGNLSIDKFSGSLSAAFAKSSRDNGYSMSFSFVNKVTMPTQVLYVNKFGPDALNEFGRGAFKEGLDRFKEVCGNKFVVQEASGAKLYVTLNVNFNSKYDKSKFELNFKGSIKDLGSAMLDIKNETAAHNISGNIQLSALQEGGNVMKLSKIFGDEKENSILKCQLKKDDQDGGIKSCIQVISDVINYAKNDFSNQIRYSDDGEGKIIGVPTSLGYSYLEYDKIGIDKIHSGITEDIIRIREFLGGIDDKMLKLEAYLQTVLYSGNVNGVMEYSIFKDHQNWQGKWYWNPEFISIDDKAQLEGAYVSAKNILQALESKYSGAIQCYKYPDSCTDVKKFIDGVISDNPGTNAIDAGSPSLKLFSKAYKLTTHCDGTEYGFRFMLPVGKDTYVEKSDFFTTSKVLEKPDAALTNIYAIKVTATPDSYKASLKIKKSPTSDSDYYDCGSFQDSDTSHAVPIYRGDTLDQGCIKALCPFGGDQLKIANLIFFEVESPV